MTKAQMLKISALVLLALLVLVTIWQWGRWREDAQAGSAYAARLTCSCRYVEGRSAESCAQDIAGDAGAVTIAEDAAAKRITGSVLLLGRRSALFRPGFGCLMEAE